MIKYHSCLLISETNLKRNKFLSLYLNWPILSLFTMHSITFSCLKTKDIESICSLNLRILLRTKMRSREKRLNKKRNKNDINKEHFSFNHSIVEDSCLLPTHASTNEGCRYLLWLLVSSKIFEVYSRLQFRVFNFTLGLK
jgi:hypothetical protein